MQLYYIIFSVMKNRFVLEFVTLLLLSGACGWLVLKHRWKDNLSPVTPMTPYNVTEHHDDTLRVLMIGDSWAGMHHNYDSLLHKCLENILKTPVRMESRGRGGAKSKDVYYLMNNKTTAIGDLRDGYGTQEILQNGADYCVVLVGINDAAANYGTENYCKNLEAIIDFLIQLKMVPVIVEMPYVDIRTLYARKTLYNIVTDWVRSRITCCRMYDVEPYSEAMLEKFQERIKKKEIIVVRKGRWNEKGCKDERGLYLRDKIHLNARGYALLDSCLAIVISDDVLGKRRH